MNLLETRGPHKFGNWTVTQVVEWEGEAFSHTVLFPDVPLQAIRAASPSGMHSRITEGGMIITANQFFILRREDVVLVIELGTGNGKHRPAEPYWNNQNLPYLETLAALNIQPDQIAGVFISHLHPDHVGLATMRKVGRWAPAFPRAQYFIHPDEWNYWNRFPSSDPRWHPCIEDSVKPLIEGDRVQWVRGGESVVGIRVHAAGGHTPGHLLFELEEEQVWFIGDLFHHPAQVAHPEWPSATYDVDRGANLHTRKRYFQRFADTKAILFAAHIGHPFQITDGAAGQKFVPMD